MATAVISNNDFKISTDDRNLEIFSLIWLDENVNIKSSRDTEQKLRSIINHLKKFEDVRQCQEYIEERSKKDRLILIVSDQLGEEIVPLIHNLRQMMSIYVYCINKKSNEQWTWKFPKVKDFIVEHDELISRITEDHQIQKKIEEPLPINIFTIKGKSTIGLNGQFVFSQVLIDCLLRLKYTQRDKIEFINLCKSEYEDNHRELNNLREFEEEYSSNKALWWYTRETFFYKTLNAALRNQDIHMIFLFREFISNIHRQLQYDQVKSPLTVYRSQLMSIDELDDLKIHIGQFISIQSFFSTSTNRTTALFFLGDTNSLIDLKLEGVLFEIDADPQMVTTKPFADISKSSHFNNETEVLFMIGSIFRLKSVNCNDDRIWIIEMSLCTEDEHDLKQVVLYMKQQIGNGETNLRTLGKVLWKMGKFDLAEKYFKRLLNELSPDDPSSCNLYEDLGELASQNGDYDMSVQWHQKLLQFKKNDLYNDRKWKQNGITIGGGNGEGNKLNQLYYPYGIFIDDNQTIYIADSENHRIIKLKSNRITGQVVAGGNGRGNEMNQLNSPRDVIIDKENNSLIISDRDNKRVMRWSLENNTNNGQIIIDNVDCFGLTMDNNGSIYVSDYKNNEVRRWKKGNQYGTIVAGGNGEGDYLNQLNCPSFICIDQDYSLYISDTGNHRVMKWIKDAKEGIVVAGGNDKGTRLTKLSEPRGVIVDQLNQIYVVDSNNHRVMRWCKGATEGTIVVGGHGQGKQPNQFTGPTGLSFDRQGNLYVADCRNHRIKKFQIN